MSPTSVSFEGFSLQTSNILTRKVSHCSAPERKLGLSQLARANGSVITSDYRTQKVIVVEGRLSSYATQAVMEAAIDALKLAVRGKSGALDIGYGGSVRRYYATAQTVDVDYLGPTVADFSIEFLCADPFGHDTTLACPVNSLRNFVTGNSGFEADVSSWAAYQGATFSQDTVTSYYGGASMKIVTSGTGTNIQGISATASSNYILNGQESTLSAWVKGSPGMVVRCYISGGFDSYTEYTLTDTRWTRIQHTKSAWSGANPGLYIMIVNGGVTVQTLYIDGVQFEQGPSASDYTNNTTTFTPQRLPLSLSGNYAARPIINVRLSAVSGAASKTLKVLNAASLASISATRSWSTAYALDFNATGQYVRKQSSDFEIGNSVTVAAWVKPDTRTGAIFNKRAPSGSFRSFNLEYTSEKFRFSVTPSDGTNPGATDPLVRPIGVWTHVAGVYDGAYVRLYVNGVEVAKTAASGQIFTSPAQYLHIGQFDAGSAGAFDGQIKTPRVWKRGLTAQEIDYVYYANRAPRDSLVLEYLMNEGSGTSLTDSSGRGNDGSITGASWVSAPSEIVINGVHKEFTVNGLPVDYSGTFFDLNPGDAAIEISDDFTSRSYQLMIAYDKRYQ